MVDEQNDKQNDRDRDAVDALLDGLHAPVTPQPKPQPTPEPTPEHDYYCCRLSDCQRCAEAVISPMKDSPGQSRFVDEYLVQADSAPRRRASMYFGQMRGKVKSCRTRAEFDDLFCEWS